MTAGNLNDCGAPSPTTSYTYSPTATTTTSGVNIVGTNMTATAGADTVTLSGFATTQVLVFSKPLASASGGLLLYDAYSPWPSDGYVGGGPPPVFGQTWMNYASIYGNNGGSDVLLWSATLDANNYLTAAAAQAALAAQLPQSFTGYATYKVKINDDPNPGDNRGGLSLLVEVRTPGWVPTTTTPGSGGANFMDVVCSEALAAGDLVNLWNNGGVLNARKANAADDTKQPDGYVLSAFASGWTARVYFPGTINAAVSGLTVNSRYFLSPTTGGALTATQPSTTGQWSQIVGKALSATQLLFFPENGFIV